MDWITDTVIENAIYCLKIVSTMLWMIDSENNVPHTSSPSPKYVPCASSLIEWYGFKQWSYWD
jgi:hypothetical protein